jgi:dTDP-4-amino-4,6-dideoxygalactose transaminase
MNVPFLDLKRQFADLKDEVMPAVENVFSRAAFIMGEEVERFEREFAAFTGTKHCIGLANGGDALILALRAYGIGPGDEVITVANSFIASALGITLAGATPVLVDCTPETYLIDPDAVRKAVTPRTKAIMPVHLYGQAADMDPLLAVAKEHGLRVIEDAAQAHGAEYKGRTCGTMGDASGFSFYPGKNLGAFGDAGAVTTNDDAAAAQLRMLRDYGRNGKYLHDVAGCNSRLDTVQAAVLIAKLKRLKAWNEARRKNAALYRKLLAGVPVTLPVEAPGNAHVYHLFVIRTDQRDALQTHLQEQGIATGVHYPLPIHLQKAYRDLGYGPGSFPVCEAYAPQLLSLPMFPEMTEEQVAYVAAGVKSFFG